MSAAEEAHNIDFDRSQSGESNMSSSKKSKKRDKREARARREADAEAQRETEANAKRDGRAEGGATAEGDGGSAKSGAKKVVPKDGGGDSESDKERDPVEQPFVPRDWANDPNYSWTNEGGSLKKLIDTETPYHARQQGGYADGKLELTFQQSRRVTAQRIGELISEMTEPKLLDPTKKISGEAARDLAFLIEKGGGNVCDAVVRAVQESNDSKTARLFATYSPAPGFETVAGWEMFRQFSVERGEDVVEGPLRKVWELYDEYLKVSSEPLMKPGQRTARRYGGGQDEHAGSGDDAEPYGKVSATMRRAFAKQAATPKRSTRKEPPIAVSNSHHAAMRGRGRERSWSLNDPDVDDVSVDSGKRARKRRDRSSRSPEEGGRKHRARSPRGRRSRSRSWSNSRDRRRSRSRSDSRERRRSRSRSDSRSKRRTKGSRRRREG